MPIPRFRTPLARSRPGRPFTPDDMELAAGFANQACLALELAEARTHTLSLLVGQTHCRTYVPTYVSVDMGTPTSQP